MAEDSGGSWKGFRTNVVSSLVVTIIVAAVSKLFQSVFAVSIGVAFGLFSFYTYAVIVNIRKNNFCNIEYIYKIAKSIAKMFAVFWIALCVAKIYTEQKTPFAYNYWQESIIVSIPIFFASIISPLIIFYLKQRAKRTMASVTVNNIQEDFTKMLQKHEISLSNVIDKNLGSIKTILDKKINISCPMATEVEEIKKTRTFAVTGTCIPFKFSNDKKKIETCLICNPNYEPAEWMFPGGHAFKTNDNEQFIDPAEIAVNRTLEEADLRVDIIDINNVVNTEDLDEDSEASENENVHEQIFIKKVPHFTYLFKLNERVECYKEKGHLYHYDCVYIGEYTKRGKENKKKKLYIQLPAECNSFKCVRTVVQDAMVKHARSINQTISPSNIDYVSLMLVNAFLKYKQIKLDETK